MIKVLSFVRIRKIGSVKIGLSFFQATHYSDSVKCAERINYILLFYNDVQVDVSL